MPASFHTLLSYRSAARWRGLLLAIVLGTTGFAQDYRWRFKQLNREDGLSETTVRCIVEDHQGFMWFASKDGLNRYDGDTIKVYRNDPDDEHSLSHNAVLSLLVDHSGALWVGTDRGLNRYNKTRDAFDRFLHDPADSHALSDNLIYSLFEDRQQRLWVGTNHGLNLFNPTDGSFRHYYHSSTDTIGALRTMSVRAIQDDGRENLWVGTADRGLLRLDPWTQQFQEVLAVDVRSIAEHPDGTMWVGSHDGLWAVSPETGGITRHGHRLNDPTSLSSNFVDSLLLDTPDRLLVGTDGGGLSILNLDTGSFQTMTHHAIDEHSLGSNVVRSLFKDSKGDLWVGLFNGGVSYHNRVSSNFRRLRHDPENPNTLSHSSVLSHHEDATGIVWIGTEAGLNRYDPRTGRFRHYQHDPADPTSLSANAVLAIHQDATGDFWIGTYNGGLNHFDPATGIFTHFQPEAENPFSLKNPHVWEVWEDRHGELWLATFDGVHRFDRDNDRFIHYPHKPDDPSSIGHNIVRHIVEDSTGELWFCTEGGLSKYLRETDNFRTYSRDDNRSTSFSDTNVTTAFEDSAGRFWVGTKMGGLNLFDRAAGTAIAYNSVHGLPSAYINAITEDLDGHIWLSTNAGLSEFDPETDKFINYDEGDGVLAGQFVRNSVLQRSTGELFFGGYEGLVVFDPARVRDNPHIPNVVLTDFLIFNQPVDPRAEGSPLSADISETTDIYLDHDQSVITFRFAALNFRSPENNQYAFRLEGFDQDWMQVGSQNYATYTNLDPGEYVFRVKGSNDAGVWNEEGTSVRVHIAFPYWSTWWFRALTGGTLLFVLGLPFYVRTRTIRSNNAALKRDIARRKQAEVALHRSEVDLSTTLDSIADAVIATNDRGVITRMNPVAEKLTGWARHQASGRNLSEVFRLKDPETHEPIPDSAQETIALRHPVSINSPVLLESKSGATRKISENCAPILDPSGNATGTVLIFRDVTQQQEIEARLRQSEKMDAIGKLAGGIAHDFNNMLSAIIGSTELLQLSSKPETEDQEYVKVIQNAALQASELTSKLLAFSRKGKACSRPLNLHLAVEQTTSILKRTIDRRVVIKSQCEAENTTILGDFSQVQNAIFNLGINGRDAMPDGGLLVISTRNITLTRQECEANSMEINPGHYLQLRVSDSGLGMDEATRQKIFEPFFTTKKAGKGTGLGLASVYGMVKEHSGSIHVESTPGNGSTFVMNFPVILDVLPDEQSDQDHAQAGEGTILLVDDEDVLRTATRGMLNKIGYRVITADNGHRALELLAENPAEIDLVLLDMVMPRMSGLECLQEIRRRLPKLPVIMSSGFTRDERMNVARKTGVQGIISKPYRMAEFSRLISKVLSRSRADNRKPSAFSTTI